MHPNALKTEFLITHSAFCIKEPSSILMGRKKGKQGGLYGSKSKRAAAQYDIQQVVSERSHQSILDKKRISSSTIGNELKFSLSSRPRIVANTIHLRGLLRERLLEDRQRDANHRRATRMAAPSHLRGTRRVTTATAAEKEPINLMHAGWMMHYDHKESLAGIESREKSICMHGVNSLENMATRSLASVLKGYISALGKEYVRERISILPSHIITSLSAHCDDTTDETAFVLGQLHVDKLVLNASGDRYHSVDDEDEICKTTMGADTDRLTSNGLLEMFLPQQKLVEGQDIFDKNQSIVSWEDMDLDQENDCLEEEWGHLRRLELKNLCVARENELFIFFRHCPLLTHLSLANSLNATIGPNILLWGNHSDAGSILRENLVDTTLGKTKTILDSLPNLQILDLSGCRWLHFDLLELFLKRITMMHSRGTKDSHLQYKMSLKMVCVGGCGSYLCSHYELLNQITNGHPLICLRPPSSATID